MEGLGCLGCLSHTIGHAGFLLTDHGDATQSLEQDAEGEEKPLLFHQEIALHASCTGIELSEDEVPVAGMGRQTDNILVGMVLCDLCGPSPALI